MRKPSSQIDTYRYEESHHATQSIRNILENEYDHQDLTKFYNTVEKEFSLGLRCARRFRTFPIKKPSNVSKSIADRQTNSVVTTIRYLY
jgi:hypothetical protein